MKIINPSVELMGNHDGQYVLKHIEACGRTCYQSEPKEGGTERFIRSLIRRGHESVLEHASFCFEIDFDLFAWLENTITLLSEEHGFRSFIRFTADNKFLVSGNVRAWRDLFKHIVEWIGIPVCFEPFIKENSVLFPEMQDVLFETDFDYSIRPIYVDDLKTGNEFLTHCDVTVRFVVDRGISHEIVRHRLASYSQESTRYCCYEDDKYGREITVIRPIGLSPNQYSHWGRAMIDAECYYMDMLREGATPEMARSVLPNSLKTTLVMTANLREWRHFFKLRCDKAAHPQMRQVAIMALKLACESFPVFFDDLAKEYIET